MRRPKEDATPENPVREIVREVHVHADVPIDYSRAPWWSESPAHVDPAARYDKLWRKQPVRMGFIQFARVVPGLAALMAKRVPGDFWTQIDDGVWQVSCPCGKSPQLEWNVLHTCECNRVYVYLGGDVRVGYVTPEGVVD